MEEQLPYLTGYEIIRASNCEHNIQDKLDAIKSEIHKEKPYKGYMLEKLQSILWDTKCLISMCENDIVESDEDE